MITNAEPSYFRALIDFERDILPPASPSESAGAAFGRTTPRVNPRARHTFGAVPGNPDSPSGGGCAEEFFPLSYLEPLEAV